MIATINPRLFSKAITSNVSLSGWVRLPIESAQFKKCSREEMTMQLQIIIAFTMKNFFALFFLASQ